MATLDPGRWQSVSPYLDQALDIADDDERAAWLASLREQHPAVAAELERLLDEHRALARERFLEDRVIPMPGQAALAGQTIGAYTLVSPIGQGGMGTVWLAEQSDGYRCLQRLRRIRQHAGDVGEFQDWWKRAPGGDRALRGRVVLLHR